MANESCAPLPPAGGYECDFVDTVPESLSYPSATHTSSAAAGESTAHFGLNAGSSTAVWSTPDSSKV